MLSYYVIYCEKFKKVIQRTEKEALRIVLKGYTFYLVNVMAKGQLWS